MAQYIADVYSNDQLGETVTAAATPNDGIFDNILIGSRSSELMFGESGFVSNQFFALRGDDVMYGGSGAAYNIYIGGGGIDTAMIAAPSYSSLLYIDYQGGLEITRPGGGVDAVNSETEITQFSNGFRLLTISGGVDDSSFETNWIAWHPGDSLAVSLDWVYAYSAGHVLLQSADYNLDGFMDLSLTGLAGVNTTVLLGYNQFAHVPTIAGVFGDGIIIDLN